MYVCLYTYVFHRHKINTHKNVLSKIDTFWLVNISLGVSYASVAENTNQTKPTKIARSMRTNINRSLEMIMFVKGVSWFNRNKKSHVYFRINKLYDWSPEINKGYDVDCNETWMKRPPTENLFGFISLGNTVTW